MVQRAQSLPSNEEETAAARKKKKSGWDDSSSPLGQTITPASEDCSKAAGSQTDLVSELAAARQLQAASIAALMQSRASLNQMSRVYVGSLDYSLAEADIRQVFSAFGTVINIDMPREGTRSKGFCFVEYASPESADLALATMAGFTLKGRQIKVGRPSSMTQSSSPQLMNATGGGLDALLSQMHSTATANSTAGTAVGSSAAAHAGILAATALLVGGNSSSGAAGTPVAKPSSSNFSESNVGKSEGTGNEGLEPESDDVTPSAIMAAGGGSSSEDGGESKVQALANLVKPESIITAQNRVYVGSVPYSFAAEDVKQIFQVFGRILSCQLIPSVEKPGTHRGYGFIEFETVAQAKLAIDTMNGFEVAGKVLKVNFATILKYPTPIVAAGITGGSAGTIANALKSTTGMENVTLPETAGTKSPSDKNDACSRSPALEIKTEKSSDQPSLEETVAALARSSPAYSDSRVICMSGMVTADEVDDDFLDEIRLECTKFGRICDAKLSIDHRTQDSVPPSAVRVFVCYASSEEAHDATQVLNGRYFGGRKIVVKKYCEQSYNSGDLHKD